MTNAANFNDYSGDGVFGRDRALRAHLTSRLRIGLTLIRTVGGREGAIRYSRRFGTYTRPS